MNAEGFVRAIEIAVYRDTVSNVLQHLADPPGKQPPASLVKVSQWFHNLAPDDRKYLAKAIDLAAHVATHHFLAVLDGIRAIEDVGEKGELELFFHKGQTRVRLNNPEKVELTSLFK
jgi:hypothetical protein